MSVEAAAHLSRPARGRTQARVVSAARRPARRSLARFGVDLGSEHLSHRSSMSVMAEARHVPDDTRHPCRKTDGTSLSHGSRMSADRRITFPMIAAHGPVSTRSGLPMAGRVST